MMELMTLPPKNLKVSLVDGIHDHIGPAISLEVYAVGMQVDRTYIAGWVFGRNQRKIAERLAACIRAGKAFSGFRILTDIYGKTYVSADQAGFFHKRHMNKALTNLGF